MNDECMMKITPDGMTIRTPSGELRFSKDGLTVTMTEDFTGWTVGDLLAELDRRTAALGKLIK